MRNTRAATLPISTGRSSTVYQILYSIHKCNTLLRYLESLVPLLLVELLETDTDEWFQELQLDQVSQEVLHQFGPSGKNELDPMSYQIE